MSLEVTNEEGVAKSIQPLLPVDLDPHSLPHLDPSVKARAQLLILGIRLGDRVVISGQKVGTLRFCGKTKFSSGLWAGIELEKAEGDNNGSVMGVEYFTCHNKHGIFAPLSMICKHTEQHGNVPPKADLSLMYPRQLSCITFNEDTGVQTLMLLAGSAVSGDSDVHFGDRVLVGKNAGVVRFRGPTSFGQGLWLGIKVIKPTGKGDGSINGVRYFSCPPGYAVFTLPSFVKRYPPIHSSGMMGVLIPLSQPSPPRPPPPTAGREAWRLWEKRWCGGQPAKFTMPAMRRPDGATASAEKRA